jgi:hypothetical protein
MSIGVFLTIEGSYVPSARGEAMELVRAVNAKLATLALEPIADASVGPSVCEGRTGLDHIGSATLAGLGELAGGGSPHLHLLHLNPYRLVYVPRPLDRPAVLDHHENLGGRETAILMGASAGLRDELLGLAPSLGIPLEGGALSDEVAKKIDDLRPLHEGEDDWHLIENTRSAWLLMHEAALLSIRKDVPISLAG